MGYRVAVVGATGMVGRQMIKVLEERDFPVDELRLLASAKSKGSRLTFKGMEVEVDELTKDSFKGIDFALFSAGGSVSKEFAPAAAKAGAVVIDNSSAFRMERNVPLVVPEVNPNDAFKHKGIIANPNCSTIQMVVALKPLYDAFGIRRVVVATYQSVSGWGKAAIDQLWNEIEGVYKGFFKMDATEFAKKIRTLDVPQVLPAHIAMNAIPHIDAMLEDGYTKEEWKMINETKKIMGDKKIKVCPTCVRVPVLSAHSEAVSVEFRNPYGSIEDVKGLLRDADGIQLMDNEADAPYPMPLYLAGTNKVFVGRVRADYTVKSGVNLWIVADNLRKGAALNAVQIAELFIN